MRTPDYTRATGWRHLRPSGAEAPPPCVLCGAAAATVADCIVPELPPVPAGPETKEGPGTPPLPAVPAGQAWHVPICGECFTAHTA